MPGSVLSPHVNHLVQSSQPPHSNNKAGAVITSTLQMRTLRLGGLSCFPEEPGREPVITALISAPCLPCLRHFSLLGSMLQIQEEGMLRALTPQGCRDNHGKSAGMSAAGSGEPPAEQSQLPPGSPHHSSI